MSHNHDDLANFLKGTLGLDTDELNNLQELLPLQTLEGPIIVAPPNRQVIAALLTLAADTFSNHSCNDFDLTAMMPNVEQRRSLMKSVYDWMGDPDAFDPDDGYECVSDTLLMQYFADMVG